jgi:hypothetical protein
MSGRNKKPPQLTPGAVPLFPIPAPLELNQIEWFKIPAHAGKGKKNNREHPRPLPMFIDARACFLYKDVNPSLSIDL